MKRNSYKDIITIEPGKRSGKPCIRGLRITVYDVLSYLAAGMSIDEEHYLGKMENRNDHACSQ